MYSYGSPHTAAQKQDDLHERTFSSYVRIQVVVLKTYLGRWTIGRSGERGSGISVLPARYDDDDDVIRSGVLAEISWFTCTSKSHRSLRVSFSRTGIGLCIYHLLVWLNLNFFHVSQWITLPTQSCLVLYSFCANLLYSLIMWLMVSSLLLHNRHLLFCCVLSILVLILSLLLLLFTHESFSHQRKLMVFHWRLSHSKSPQVSRTLLSILAVFNNAVVWMVSTRSLTSKTSRPLLLLLLLFLLVNFSQQC